MKILLIGDIVGKPGKTIVQRALPGLRVEAGLDFIVANAENIAGGSGITPKIYRELKAAGVDCVTMGDHIYRRSEIDSLLNDQHQIVKPANFPRSAPGRDWAIVPAANGVQVAVFSLLGRLFMRPVDCPWTRADQILQELPADVRVRVVDFHAEATSEKQLMGRYLDGRVSAVLGTHTHVATADEQIFPGGTAFQCDVGMTGPFESILGREIHRVMHTTITFRPTFFQVAKQDVRLGATIVEVDPDTGRATGIRRIQVTEQDLPRLESLCSPVLLPGADDED